MKLYLSFKVRHCRLGLLLQKSVKNEVLVIPLRLS